MKRREDIDSRQEGIRKVAEELSVRLQLKRHDEGSEKVESILWRDRSDDSRAGWRHSGSTDLEVGATSLCRLHHMGRRRRHGRVLLCRHDRKQ
jgi:hypothetical protein